MRNSLIPHSRTKLLLAGWLPGFSQAQQDSPVALASKAISPNLFGIFFEDINYAADGGLCAELVQNRSFEYTLSDNGSWNPLTSWSYQQEGYAMGTVSVESAQPLHARNPHYVEINLENPSQKGLGLKNSGLTACR